MNPQQIIAERKLKGRNSFSLVSGSIRG